MGAPATKEGPSSGRRSSHPEMEVTKAQTHNVTWSESGVKMGGGGVGKRREASTVEERSECELFTVKF